MDINQKKLITFKNVIVSIVTIRLAIIIDRISVLENTGLPLAEIFLIFHVMIAYLAKSEGLKRNVTIGYELGYFLGLPGLIMLYAMKKNEILEKLFTKKNLTASILTIILVIILDTFIFIKISYFPIASVFAFINLVCAYINRYIGLTKNINYGYALGYFLSIIGIIIMVILTSERNEINKENKNVKIYKGADEIKKYKELLDYGAITKEEYEAKKKELLKL